MNKKEIINQLIKLGWEPAPYTPTVDDGFYLWKAFEISKTKELHNYIDFQPKPDEIVFITYEIFPHLETCRYCLWTEDNPYDVIYEEDDYQNVVELAIADRLFTYPQRGCRVCRHNKERTVRQKDCKKGHRAIFGFGCRDFESYEIGHQFTIYDYLE